MGALEVINMVRYERLTQGGCGLPFSLPCVEVGQVIRHHLSHRHVNANGATRDLEGPGDLPVGGSNDPFTAGESLTYTITGAGLLASSFAYESVPDPVDPNGPFYGAAKVQSTTGCTNYPTTNGCSDWIGADTTIPPSEIPVPAAVWLFGSGLIGLAGIARRKKS